MLIDATRPDLDLALLRHGVSLPGSIGANGAGRRDGMPGTHRRAVARLFQSLFVDRSLLESRMLDQFCRRIRNYPSGSVLHRERFARHAQRHIEAIAQLGDTGQIPDLSFVREYAADLAMRGFPLCEFLHAYRIGHNIVWHYLHSAMNERSLAEFPATLHGKVATLILEYVDAIFCTAEDAYRETSYRVMVEQTLARNAMFAVLFSGVRQMDEVTASALESMGLRPTTKVRMLAARANGVDEPNVSRLSDFMSVLAPLADVFPQSLPHGYSGSSFFVVLVEDQSAELIRKLGLPRAGEALRSAGYRVAISQCVQGWQGIASAFSQAGRMLLTGHQSVAFAQPCALTTLLDALTHSKAFPDIMRVTQQLRSLSVSTRKPLAATAMALADASLNLRGAARQLHIHYNTLHYRVAKLKEATGLDATRFDDLLQLLVAFRSLEKTALKDCEDVTAELPSD